MKYLFIYRYINIFCFFHFRLFPVASIKVINEILEGKCCDLSAIEALISMYTFINPHCDMIDIKLLCEVKLHQSCTSRSNQTYDEDRSRNSTDRGVTRAEPQLDQSSFVSNICNQISKDQREVSVNRTGSNVTEYSNEKTKCDVMEAITICLGLGMDCRYRLIK